jgi:acyl-CoA hydrolase
VLTNRAYFVYVALDEFHRPVRVPRLLLDDEDARHRFAEGDVRKRRRMASSGANGA